MALKNGKDVLFASGSERGDTFGKGTVGKPSETDSIREDGNQDGLGDKTLNYGGGHFETESAGLVEGLSAHEVINPDDVEPEYNYEVDSFTGNAVERKVGRANNETVSGKGKKFELGEM